MCAHGSDRYHRGVHRYRGLAGAGRVIVAGVDAGRGLAGRLAGLVAGHYREGL